MIFLVIAVGLFFAGVVTGETEVGCWCLILSQLPLFVSNLSRGVSGVGMFTFMSVLFFAFRPAYILVEGDYVLMQQLFGIIADTAMIHRNLVWAVAGMIAFTVAGRLAYSVGGWWIAQKRKEDPQDGIISGDLVNPASARYLILMQIGSVVIMGVLASALGKRLYNSALGAYAYDMPAVLQGAQIMAVIAILQIYKQSRSTWNAVNLVMSGVLMLVFTYLMRDVSLFRGFYLGGLVALGVAFLAKWRGRVGYVWVLVPIVLVLPLFQWMGGTRTMDKSEALMVMSQNSDEIFNARSYWTFFESSGDVNIFDTFVAASEVAPSFHPYLWSWVYVPFHWVPRKLWKGKPEKGITQDFAFANGAPYSPGIAGCFVLDGGRVWMVMCMGGLGVLVATLDVWAVTRGGILRYCLYGVFVVNAMFLSRFFLWQYAYQVLYMAVPCVVLSRRMRFAYSARPGKVWGIEVNAISGRRP